MFRLRILGSVDLEDGDGRRIGSVLSQPKRLALLALLALESPRRLQRDEVLSLLWPESTHERARNSLRQALHYLRRSLGPGVVVGKNAETVGIDGDRLECDARALLEAAEAGRLREAVALYEGELLPGFHLSEAPLEFERWLDEKRRQVTGAAAESAWRLAERDAGAGRRVEAAVMARRAWEIGGQDEAGLRRLLRLLLRVGDVRGAESTYRAYAQELERDHGESPAEETRRILEGSARPPEGESEEIGDTDAEAANLTAGTESAPPGVGATGASDAVVAPAGSPGAAAPEEPAVETGSTAEADAAARGWASRWPLAAAMVVVLAGVLYSWPAPPAGPTEAELSGAPESEGASLYLAPVRSLELDAASARLAEALTAELTAELIQAEGFRVVALEEGGQEPGGPGIMLRPSLRRAGADLQLAVLVLDPRSRVALERFVVRSEETGLATPESLAGRMALKIREGVGELLTWRGLEARGISPESLALLRAAADEVETANGFTDQRALEAASLGYRAADSLLARAAREDPEWSEPRVRRAEVALAALWLHLIPPQHDPAKAHEVALTGIEAADAGIERARGDEERARALEVRGLLRYWAARTAAAEADKQAFERTAEADLEQAVTLDADRPRSWNLLSSLAEGRGEFAAAYQRARRAYRTDSDLEVPLDIVIRLFTNALEIGDAEAAGRWCEEAHERRPEHWLGYYCDLTRQAWVGPWTVTSSDSLMEEALERLPDGPFGDQLVTRFRLLQAVTLARSGETGRARAALATLEPAEARDPEVLTLQAWVRAALGDIGAAQEILTLAERRFPAASPRVLKSRRFADLSTYTVVRDD